MASMPCHSTSKLTRKVVKDMYRIYWLDSSDEWVLFSRAGNEDKAYAEWNICCDLYPNHRVKITKEVMIKEAQQSSKLICS